MNRIALFKGTDPIGRLIRLQTRSQYSHAAILRSDDSVVEATGKPLPFGDVAHVESISSQHPKGIAVDIFAVDAPFEVEKADRWLENTLGMGYDFRSVLRFVTRVPADVNERYFCSEHVFAYWLAGNVKLLERIEPHHVAPWMLALSPHARFLETRTT